MESTTWRTRWSWRRAIVRTALALGLSVVGWVGLSPDAQAAHAVPENKWPRRGMRFGNGGCRVAYQMETDTDQVRDMVYQVINYINVTTPCVWEPRQWWDWDYVAITENDWNILWFTDLAANAGGIGVIGGRQEMHLCHGCNDFGLILHEMGHTMGFLHEHQRPDRDNFVNIYYQFVQQDAVGAFQPYWWGTYLGLPYDVRSVMHYGKRAFMSPPAWPYCVFFACNTIDIKGYPQGELGSTYFTDTDLKGLSRRYPIPNRLEAMHSGKCVDIPGANAFDGAVVQQYDCHEGANQGWLLRWWDNDGSTDYYLLESADPWSAGKCMDVQWASQNPGAPVIMWPCHGGASQQWSVVPVGGLNTGYYVRARHSGQCMDVAWASYDNGAQIVQSSCSGGQNQIWGKSARPFNRTREQPDPRCGNPRDPC